MTLTPAYGRTYKSQTEVLADLQEGKDFYARSVFGEGYVNILQLRDGLYTVRYGKNLSKAMGIRVSGGKVTKS